MNTTQTHDLEAKYTDQAFILLDQLETGIKKATGIKGTRRGCFGTYFFEIEEPSVQIMIDHERAGSGRFNRHWTGNPSIRVDTRGKKTHFHKRADGTYNIEKILGLVSKAVAAYKAFKEANERTQLVTKENDSLMKAELGAIELPKGVSVHRDPLSRSLNGAVSG
jgi:hypothetical protein